MTCKRTSPSASARSIGDHIVTSGSLFLSDDRGVFFQTLPQSQGTPRESALSGRRMLERELAVTRLLEFDHEDHSPLRAAKGEWLARVLERDGVHVLQVGVRATLDHASSKLGFLIRVVEVDDGE